MLPELKENPTLTELQHYQHAMCEARGWNKSTELETFLLFTEEIGELAKAIRYRIALFTEKGTRLEEDELQGEFADVLGYLLELANKFNINLEEAFRRKEAINAKRDWN
ncbi:MAG: MazG nucleotide pyrophosphohydrolase domain-containing protein [Flammeovirgaceae bacterium]